MNNDFEFKYVAPTSDERKEIESIRNSYILKGKQDNKLNYLRNLDNKVKNMPNIISLTIGILGTLIFGLGLAMILEWEFMIGGTFVGCLGLIIMIIVYPIYLRISMHLKNKYSKEILEISEELLNGNDK